MDNLAPPIAEKRRSKRIGGGRIIIKECSNALCTESSDQLMPCNDCSLMFHPKCCGMDEQLYNLLLSSDCSGLTWIWRCCSCKSRFDTESPKSSDLSDQLENISSSLKLDLSRELKKEITLMQRSLNTRLDDLENKGLPNITNQIAKKVESQTNDVRNQLTSYASKVKENINDTSKINNKVNTHLKRMNIHLSNSLNEEEKDIQNRAKNLCLFNIPESLSEDPNVRYKEDLNKIRRVLNGKVCLQKGDVINLRRIKNGPEKTSPIIITLSDEEKRLQILKSRNLKLERDSEQPILIYCSPDRTLKQRQLYKELLENMRERREKGETGLIIRNYKIVQFQQSRFNPDDHWEDND